MSILDFAKDIGRQVFDRDDLAADNISEMLSVKLTPIKNLDVAFDDGTVTLCGECLNQKHHDQAILLAGNVKGVGQVIADDLAFPAPQANEPAVEKVDFYEIKSGDTLSGIAKEFYGDYKQYTRIFEANKDVIEDPDKIYPGQKIRIPMD